MSFIAGLMTGIVLTAFGGAWLLKEGEKRGLLSFRGLDTHVGPMSTRPIKTGNAASPNVRTQ